jgi:hypothetical protein
MRLLIIAILLALMITPSYGKTHYRARRSPKVETRVFLPSRQSQLAQNAAIDRMGLSRYRNDRELEAAKRSGELVPLPTSGFLSVSNKLPCNRRYVRPWVTSFLIQMATAYYARFDVPLQVNSAVRTMAVQRGLMRWNPNAAPIHGDVASSHLAGTTVDLERRRLTQEQIWWIEGYLLGMGDSVIVIEELREPCFHIMVLPELRDISGGISR